MKSYRNVRLRLLLALPVMGLFIAGLTARGELVEWLQNLEGSRPLQAVSSAPFHCLAVPWPFIRQYSASYSVSIEDFADEVKSWIDKQGDPTFRLNFFVDEVGQFIGSDTKLMLNLQTIAESLNTKCAGRSWVFVTSQEDMEKVIGDRTRQQGNDFSKIQARFKTRLKLTSADVEEVIRKRLLEKNDAGAAALSKIYARRARQLQDAVQLRRRSQDLPQLPRRVPPHRDLPVRQLPVPAVPSRNRGHLRPQRLRGPQQLGR